MYFSLEAKLSLVLLNILIISASNVRETGRARDSSRKPRITAVTKTQLKDVGDSVTLACSVRDGNEHEMLWYKLPNEEKGETRKMLISAGKTLVLEDDRMEVKSSPNYNSLQLNNLKDTDFGTYQCRVGNSNVSANVDIFIRSSPVILESSSTSVSVREGQTAVLSCFANGYPEPEIYWSQEKNFNVDQSQVKGNLFTLSNITKDRRGRYYCLAVNSLGEKRHEVDVHIVFPPTILDNSTTTLEVSEGGTAVLACHADGFPVPDIFWSKNKELTAKNSKVVGSTVNITGITREKRGFYYCLAKNNLGESRHTVNINVVFPPDILHNSSTIVEVPEGGTAILACHADGFPVPEIYWSKNKDFTWEESKVFGSVVNITGITREKSGSYYCLAKNSLGETRHTVTVNVVFPPAILENSSTTLEVHEGGVAILACHADGNPVPHIFWSRNEHFTWEESNVLGNILNITGITRQISGSYYCLAKNSLGESRHVVSVNVVFPPAILDNSSTTIEVLEGGTAILACHADGIPVSNIYWSRNKDFTWEESKVFGSFLNITEISKEKNGFYYCLAKNSLGETRHTVELHIVYPPTILNNSTRTIEVPEGGRADFACHADGFPIPKIYWSKNKDFTWEESKVFGSVVNITGITRDKRGPYYCLAKNRLGEARHIVTVNVVFPPAILNNSTRTIEVVEGGTAVLSCQADGFPVPEIYWSKNIDFTWEESTVLGSGFNITGITREKAGYYYCIAKNNLGESRLTVHVNVVYPPNILRNSSRTVEVVQGETAVLACHADGNPVPKIFWSMNKNFTWEESQVFGSILNITRITRKFRGRYYCLAQNNLGESRHSVDVEIEFPPVSLPNNSSITVSEGGTANLTCFVDANPPPVITWSLDKDAFNASKSKFHGRILNLNRITKSNRGPYYCLATNRLGAIRQRINLEVEFAPVIDAPTTLTDCSLKGNIVLECHVIGFPLPSIKWIKNNTEIVNDDHFRIFHSSLNSSFTNATLHITSLELDHFGLYTCMAENKLGVASERIRILERVVRGLPVIPIAVNSTDSQITNKPTAFPTTRITTAIPTTSITTAIPATSITTAIPTTSITTAIPTTSITTAIPTTSITTAIPTTNIPTVIPSKSDPTLIRITITPTVIQPEYGARVVTVTPNRDSLNGNARDFNASPAQFVSDFEAAIAKFKSL